MEFHVTHGWYYLSHVFLLNRHTLAGFDTRVSASWRFVLGVAPARSSPPTPGRFGEGSLKTPAAPHRGEHLRPWPTGFIHKNGRESTSFSGKPPQKNVRKKERKRVAVAACETEASEPGKLLRRKTNNSLTRGEPSSFQGTLMGEKQSIQQTPMIHEEFIRRWVWLKVNHSPAKLAG